ncbi:MULTISPECIES: endonuclease/exonuclease/phosphatase family protein [unclassified Treponema]|uniref:endonuclease/exonuclease/phosphatase family protein n=1 Tax=unclassified Treponema TaxID=2638727 RepID=UPI0020A5E697|nr:MULTISPECIES: endonuclease/exonuclease/phosphatase family protein [unclassified Treponema]UTC66359.1 endonuclease/exonuclease/phosphatase family protein [Treponema sp. OMZ 789]UTC69089.1 endonuclease/exonuclease/phosphatase family protein [Treponema sp. OMZ 790]UTC71801.1 endonuclease/exonuclease/phosphatase family protein [Treponema sp. OMZ 791]
MNKLKNILALSIFTCFCLLLLSCTGCTNVFRLQNIEKDTISIVSYNAQTFFDAVEDGSEFKEFKGSKTKWSKERYAERLSRLKETLNLSCLGLGLSEKDMPDILILQEIESQTVIDDFCKSLPLRNSYKYAVFIPPKKGGAFSTALLSKFPIIETKVFNIYSGKSILRPLIEARIRISESGGNRELMILNVHWKSKVGNSGSENLRRMQEEQAYKRLLELKNTEPQTPFIICGDFNQTLKEFSLLSEFDNCWNIETYKNAVKEGSQPSGSYFYGNSWEGIDHFFYSDNLSDGKDFDLSFFCVINSRPLVDESGKPERYSVYTGKGYSDHLPIGIILKRQ